MPKLRNGSNDTEMFAQWLGRKCRNHHPLSELAKTNAQRKATPNIYNPTNKARNVAVMKSDPTTVIYSEAGRTFQLAVTEIDEVRAEVRAFR